MPVGEIRGDMGRYAARAGRGCHVRLHAHVCVQREVEEGRVAARKVEQREQQSLDGVVERKDDLSIPDGAQVRRRLAVKVPRVHEWRAVREGEALLLERVVPVAPVVVLAVEELGHVRDRLTSGRLAPSCIRRRQRDATEGEELGELLLARLGHRHVERRAIARRVGPRQHRRKAALARVKVGEEHARDSVGDSHGHIGHDAGHGHREQESQDREVTDHHVRRPAEGDLRRRHSEHCPHALCVYAPVVVASRSGLGSGPEAERGDGVIEAADDVGEGRRRSGDEGREECGGGGDGRGWTTGPLGKTSSGHGVG